MSGYLKKKGEKNDRFKRRWCELEGVTISYYTSKDNLTKKAGSFHIGGAEVVRMKQPAVDKDADGAAVAVDETVELLHPPLPLVGASTVMERERQQNDSLVDG